MEDVVTPGGVGVPVSALSWRFSRSGGPGGQGVNTTDSQVELSVDLAQLVAGEELRARVLERLGTTLTVRSSVERSQLANRRDALGRALERIDEAARVERVRRRTRVPRWAREERMRAKRARSATKADRRGE